MQWVPAPAVSLIGQHGHIRSAASSVRRSEPLCGRPSAVPASGPNLLQRARGTPYPPAMKVVAILTLLVYTVGTFGFVEFPGFGGQVASGTEADVNVQPIGQ